MKNAPDISRTKVYWNTVGSKIIRALEIICFKKLIPNAALCNKYLLRHDLEDLYCL